MTEAQEVDRPFYEAPIFRQLDATSFTFAFELAYRTAEGDDPDRTALRLRHASDRLNALKAGTPDERAIFKTLIQPIRSFLDDVTMGPAGTNGRPALFAASGARPNAASRSVWLVRPERWTYEYENEVSELAVDPQQRLHHFRLRDSFAAFESGRLFYLLTLTQAMPEDEETRDDEDSPTDPDMAFVPIPQRAREHRPWTDRTGDARPQPIDEYAVLQLQQLALDPRAHATDGDYLGFWHDEAPPGDAARPLSLIELAERRLRALEQGQPSGPNGIRDILIERDLVPREHRRKPIGPADLRRLCVGIESDAMLDTADRVNRRFPGPEGGTAPALGWFDGSRRPPDNKPRWQRAFRGKPIAGREPHDDPENEFDRDFLAFAGIAQGVPDFPYQDESEVHDSTRPAFTSIESALYTHPRFVLEVAKSWRSFNAARPAVGTCPYLLLMFIVALHDELVVGEMEEVIDDLLYAEGAIGERGTRSFPLADVRGMLRNIRRIGGAQEAILQRNLESRFELFRWNTVHRSGNIFRYAKERGALAAIQQAMATDSRFDRAHATIDRMEALVEDVAELKSAYAARRTNGLLFLLALLGLVGLPKAFSEFAGLTVIYRRVGLAIGGALLLWFVWIWAAGLIRPGRKRRR